MYRVRRAASPFLQRSLPELSCAGGGKGSTSNYLLLPSSGPRSWVTCPCLMSLQFHPLDPGGLCRAWGGVRQGWLQPPMAHLCLAVDMSPCVDGSLGGGHGMSMGVLPIPLGMHSSLLALGMWRTGAALWDLLAGWEFSCVPGKQTQGSSTLLIYHIKDRFF